MQSPLSVPGEIFMEKISGELLNKHELVNKIMGEVGVALEKYSPKDLAGCIGMLFFDMYSSAHGSKSSEEGEGYYTQSSEAEDLLRYFQTLVKKEGLTYERNELYNEVMDLLEANENASVRADVIGSLYDDMFSKMLEIEEQENQIIPENIHEKSSGMTVEDVLKLWEKKTSGDEIVPE